MSCQWFWCLTTTVFTNTTSLNSWPISLQVAMIKHVKNIIVNYTEIYIYQYLGASAKPMLRATPIFRVWVTLSSAKEGATFTIRSIVASAGKKTWIIFLIYWHHFSSFLRLIVASARIQDFNISKTWEGCVFVAVVGMLIINYSRRRDNEQW